VPHSHPCSAHVTDDEREAYVVADGLDEIVGYDIGGGVNADNDNNTLDVMARQAQGRRMVLLFAAKMIARRILTVYREKVRTHPSPRVTYLPRQRPFDT
jgi:hypothetical protein